MWHKFFKRDTNVAATFRLPDFKKSAGDRNDVVAAHLGEKKHGEKPAAVSYERE